MELAGMHPWGHIDWILPRIGKKKWQAVVCPSFEPRCIAVPEWASNHDFDGPHYAIKVDDPPNKHTNDIDRLTDIHEAKIRALLGKDVISLQSELLTGQDEWNSLATSVAKPGASLLLDISAMPKRMFLFLVKRLMASQNVQDLVVCYTRPSMYKEGGLVDNAEPPAALPGFARVSSKEIDSTVVVSVGYMAFNLSDLLEQSRGKSLKFLFPFPPASPSIRRNWNLLNKLAPDIAMQTEIQRIHAMDMFAALEWIISIHSELSGAIDMIPLGPKPHALAMALAHKNIGESAELIYSQPREYHPMYSSGINKTTDGSPDITAYCLRRDYKDIV